MKDGLYIYIEDHTLQLFYSLILGAALALMYDGFRMIRTLLGCGLTFDDKYKSIELPLIGKEKPKTAGKTKRRTKTVLTAVFDLLYMTLFTSAVLVFFYTLTDGIVRWFLLFGIGIGALIYMKTVGEATKRTVGGILFILKALFRYLIYFTVTPICCIYRKTVKKLYFKAAVRISQKKQMIYLEKTLPEVFTEISEKLRTH